MKNYCTFYIARHGLTDWNIEKRLQGQTDIPLNKKGEEQAIKAAKEYFKGIKFEVAFSSDLFRAKRTAEIIALEKKIALKTTALLRERDFGPWEGKKAKDIEKALKKDIKEFRVLADEELAKLKIETNHQMMSRFMNFLRETAILYPGKNVLVVTHGSVMRIFLQTLGYINKEQSQKLLIENLAYFILESDGVDFKVKKTVGIFVK
ncbi:MAG: histidine phosphatase family protein [Patescibacteria group bacterium]|nr:histidine phosphatase family protein [Patescibacteria group bacterium]